MRNYQEYPLNYSEKPKKEDLEFLYIHENKTKKELMKYFDRNKDTVTSWFKYYNIKKPQELIRQSIERVQLERYGAKYYMQSKFYQDKKEQINQKRAKTNLRIYGTKSPGQNEEIKRKIKQTCLNDIDNMGLNIYQRARKKGIQTCLAKYGVTTYSQTQECKNKTEQKWKENFGVKSFGETEKFKQLYNNKQWVNNIIHKIYSKKKVNHSYNKSDEEENIYKNLINKFGNNDIVRQYKSAEYPFACDFYIKPLHLYIEYNGHFTHGKEPFDKNNVDHLKILDKWKQKNTRYYQSAIKTWTNKDVQKLETFQKHNLNYKIFYTIDEFNQWYKTI